MKGGNTRQAMAKNCGVTDPACVPRGGNEPACQSHRSDVSLDHAGPLKGCSREPMAVSSKTLKIYSSSKSYLKIDALRSNVGAHQFIMRLQAAGTRPDHGSGCWGEGPPIAWRINKSISPRSPACRSPIFLMKIY